ncbi:MAG: hypothetical protein ACI8TX_003037 [Hyphomicrobiaceae bacterium]|jgi:hypothetical protein
MLLRASGELSGTEVNIDVVVEPDAAGNSGVPAATELIAFVDAALRGSTEELEQARVTLRDTVGDAGLIDAAATVGNFERMNRIADATGIALDAPVRAMSADLIEQLGSRRFASAASTKQTSPIVRALASRLRPIGMRLAVRAMAYVRKRNPSH